MKRLLAYLLVFLIGVVLALAAGGGGGGGSGSGGGSSGGSGGSGGGGGEGPFLRALECNDKGALSFSQSPQLKPVQVFTKGKNWSDVPGEWDGVQFTSEEASFIKPGTYTVKDSRNGDKSVDCPGLTFSCKIAKLQVRECSIYNDKLTAAFVMENATLEQVKFTLQQGTRRLTHYGGAFSPELQTLRVTKKGVREYIMEVPNAGDVEQIEISLPDCAGRHYIYSQMNCIQKGQRGLQQELKGTQLKCGGYMNIHDRVKCRLQLREEERNEYENFFPEECKSHTAEEEQQQCLRRYQAVQECWDFPNGPSRITCVQRVLKLGDILAEKANCNALDAGQRINCNQNLTDKVQALVKFRLYNLEEEAEHLQETGKLTLEQVTDFVVKMEQHKLRFNAAGSTPERKQILIEARQDWLDLVRMVGS